MIEGGEDIFLIRMPFADTVALHRMLNAYCAICRAQAGMVRDVEAFEECPHRDTCAKARICAAIANARREEVHE